MPSNRASVSAEDLGAPEAQGSTRSSRKHKQTEHSTSKECAYTQCSPMVAYSTRSWLSWEGTSSDSPFTGEKCLRSKPRREAKGTICRAQKVDEEKHCTTFQSTYNKIKGQHTAVCISAQGILGPL